MRRRESCHTKQAADAAKRRLPIAVLLAWYALAAFSPCRAADEAKVVTIDPPEMGFYSKRVSYKGIVIKAHADVDDKALVEARSRIARNLSRIPAVAQNLANVGMELCVVGKNQSMTDLPHYRYLKDKPGQLVVPAANDKDPINPNARMRGGLQSFCSEENLLQLPNDMWGDHRDTVSSCLAYAIYFEGVQPSIREEVQQLYEQSMAAKLWKTAYAATQASSFFAELSMWYFESRGDLGNIKPPPEPGRAWLHEYDPDAFDLLDRFYTGQVDVEKFAWQKAAEQPVRVEGSVRSYPSKSPVKIVLFNQTANDYSIFWLDGQGLRRPEGLLRAGQKYVWNTYFTHPWLVATAKGKPVRIFIAGEKNSSATIK